MEDGTGRLPRACVDGAARDRKRGLRWARTAASGLLCIGAIILERASSQLLADNPLQLRAHHATALVQDLDRAVHWYRNVLGFALTEHGSRGGGTMNFAEMKIPGYGVALVQLRGASAPSRDTSSPSAAAANSAGPATSGWTHIAFAVPDASRAYALLKARGAEPSLRPGQPTDPVTSFTIHDSEGNEIEILSEP